MNPLSLLVTVLGSSLLSMWLIYSILKFIGKSLLNHTVAFHIRNLDTELDDLLRRDKEV